MAEVALKEQLKKHSEVVTDYAKVVLEMLSSDDLLQKSKESAEIVSKIRSKVDKGKENTATTIKTLEEKKCKIEQATLDEYRTAMDGVPDTPSQPDMHAVKDEVHKTHKQAREMERDLKKLENEKKIIEFHKKHRKLQATIANVTFDMSSNDKQVKGYTQKPDGTLEVFEFDFTKDCPCHIADTLWDKI